MNCANCGSALGEGGNFCTRCGARAWPAQPPPTAYQPVVAAAPAPADHRPPQADRRLAQADHRPPPGGGRLSRAIALLAALVTLVLGAVTLTAALSPTALPLWTLRWLLFLPLPLSVHVAEAEMILLIVLAGIVLVRTLTVGAKRGELVALALAYVGVMVGNAAAFPGGMSVSSYFLGQSGATATWVGLALVLAAGLGSVFAATQSTAVAVGGLVVGVVITVVSAGVSVAQADSLTAAFGFPSGAQTYLPVTSTGTGTGTGTSTGTGAGTSTGGSQAAPASSNQPGSCAAGWTSLLDVTAPSMRATVCQSAGQTFLAARLSDGSTIDVPAAADGSGWSAEDGATTYTVDPGFIAIYTDGQLASDQATTTASGSRSTPSALAQLAAMVKLAHQGRAEVAQLDQLTQGCGSAAEGASLIGQVTANRAQLLAAAQKLAQDPSASGLPVAQFVSSMQWSLNADHAWQHWITNAWQPWAAGGCAGQVARNGRTDFDQFVADSKQADQAKTAFVNAYDPIAAQHGLQSNWTGLDI